MIYACPPSYSSAEAYRCVDGLAKIIGAQQLATFAGYRSGAGVETCAFASTHRSIPIQCTLPAVAVHRGRALPERSGRPEAIHLMNPPPPPTPSALIY
ncbi:hypothetical protein EVAR_28110_1 [Eumeta japonica]|uniref:Uncharacterized protein n=1 Tax=Eumeta variegata TaxID=151549 RepID=A0A4C1VDU3_EUMVA|nr:hypothetical protein EVAR_28110_1 [Eumeta japonica]